MNIKWILLPAVIIFLAGCSHQEQKTEKTVAEQESMDSTWIKARGKLTAEVLWKFGRLSDIRLSPDHKKVLFGVTFYNLKKNSGNRDLYILNLESKETKKLTSFEGSEWNAVWRPDGQKIAFISSMHGKSVVYEINPDGTDTVCISGYSRDITGFMYAPDMKHVLFISAVKLDKSPDEIYPDLPEARVRIIDDLMYRHWDQWHDYTYNHIFVAPYNDGSIGEARDIMEGEKYDCPMKPWGGMEQIAWSPDGKTIAYTCKKLYGKEYSLSTNSEIYLYNLENGQTTCLTENGFEGYDQDPVFSPDGKWLVFRSMEEDGFESDKDRIMVYHFETGEFKDYSENFDQSSSHFVWTARSDGFYFISGIHATYQIYYLDLASGNIRQITRGWHNYQSIENGGDFLIGTKMSMSMPTEIFSINPRSGEETQLSHVNDFVFEHIKMGQVRKRWVTTTDNKQMLVWVIYPPDFDSTRKYPALLYCQGGPQSAVSQFFSYRWNFQIMAAHDYIVVAPNRRGLPTFGQEWNDQISGDYGGQNMKDYLSAIDDVAREPYVDKEHLGAVGASYGGYSVFWLAGHHEGRFKAFIAHCGIYNFESMYASTDEYWFVNKDMEGPYWQKPRPKSYDFSPHLYVQNWDTPILIITGENDFRIPYTQSLEAFNSAILNNVKARLLVFPDETHFVTQPQNAVLWQREFFNWLDTYLKP